MSSTVVKTSHIMFWWCSCSLLCKQMLTIRALQAVWRRFAVVTMDRKLITGAFALPAVTLEAIRAGFCSPHRRKHLDNCFSKQPAAGYWFCAMSFNASNGLQKQGDMARLKYHGMDLSPASGTVTQTPCRQISLEETYLRKHSWMHEHNAEKSCVPAFQFALWNFRMQQCKTKSIV